MRKLKCKVCEEYSTSEDMEKVGTRYIHKDNCLQEYNDDMAFKNKEKKELDKLIDSILRVHKISTIPNQFYPFLQDLRNGNQRRGQIVGTKKYKSGYSYRTIMYTYKTCKHQISYANKTIKFKGILPMLKYSLAIIKDKIYNVDKELKALDAIKRNEKKNRTAEENRMKNSKGTSYNYTKQKNNGISDFID